MLVGGGCTGLGWRFCRSGRWVGGRVVVVGALVVVGGGIGRIGRVLVGWVGVGGFGRGWWVVAVPLVVVGMGWWCVGVAEVGFVGMIDVVAVVDIEFGVVMQKSRVGVGKMQMMDTLVVFGPEVGRAMGFAGLEWGQVAAAASQKD